MSLVVDNFLLRLWEEAQQSPDDECVSRTFWLHLLSKYIFLEKRFLVTAEAPPSYLDSRRRVDIIVKNLDLPNPCVLLFIESKKKNAGPSDFDQVEHQAFTACVAYVVAHNLRSVKAMTTIGTKARMWEYETNGDYLTPLHGGRGLSDASAYIEAHSPEATTLLDHLNKCKSVKPPT
ncbi:MAG: hypothetical protein LQ340_003840 [Diploschistes diacapsis]|nr:MAG: hypothetical protein LQ340_003840 [Diploschistes diacapsis]